MLTAHAPQILDSFGKFIELVAQEFSELGVKFDGYTEPRVHKDRWLTNKSPFIYGRHKVEYEVRTYKKVTTSPRHFVTFLLTFDQFSWAAFRTRNYKRKFRYAIFFT